MAKNDYVLEEQIGHVLRRAHQRASAIFMANFAEHGLTPTQFAALAKIRDEGEVSQNYLGRLTAMDPATMKGVIGRLHKRRVISRQADPADGRRTLWRLTASGERLLARTVAVGEATTNKTLAPLAPKERKTVLDLLSRLT
ncbi:MAG: MarR family winged helix-turn-helix transcriptional regulator [Alphaproteobacteria bacterium]|jgi:DNA-binding MarR family transcriptional regulator